jgi:ArsR family transcriptional regulator
MKTLTAKTSASCTDACITPATPVNGIGLIAQAKVFKALADETRLRILEQLASAGAAQCACHIEGCCDLAQPTISHHLKVLREAGLIVGERRGTWIYYSINREAVAALPEVLGKLVSHQAQSRPAGAAV